MTTNTPLIGLPGRRKSGSQIEGFGGILSDLAIDMYVADYARGIINAGGIPVHIPLDLDPSLLLPRLDGLLLTGGADILPFRYGQEAEGFDYEDQRDVLEFALLDGAIKEEIPVLGICRGLQLLNVAAGGTLHQDVPKHARYDVSVDELAHQVAITPGSRLAGVYGAGMGVNTLHHQTVNEVGEGLTVTATAPDGTVEGLEMKDHTVIAVQWHPEMLDTTDPIFGWLVDQARRSR